MASGKIEKGPLILDGKMLEVFGSKGFISGDEWAVEVMPGIFSEITPTPANTDIAELISKDEAAGNGEKIAYIHVDGFNAVRLYLDGTITSEHIEAATASEDEVIFENVMFGAGGAERPFKVIAQKSDIPYATMDTEGNVV